MNRRTKVSTESGFSLVETVVSLAVVGIMVMALLQTQVSNLQVTRTSNDLIVATAELQSCMEQALALGPEGLLGPGSAFVHGAPVAAFDNRVLKHQSIVVEYPSYTAGDPIPETLEIRQTLTWTDSSGQARSMVAATVAE